MPLARGILLYEVNLLFKTMETSILMPTKTSETIIIEGVICQNSFIVSLDIANLLPLRLGWLFQSFCHSFMM
jgi:hypothetical protein